MTLFSDYDLAEWQYTKCPFCGEEYPYPKDGYRPITCGRFDCLQAYFFPKKRVKFKSKKEVEQLGDWLALAKKAQEEGRR